MNALDEQVGGEQQVFFCAGRPEDGAVIADTGNDSRATRYRGPLFEARENALFGQHHRLGYARASVHEQIGRALTKGNYFLLDPPVTDLRKYESSIKWLLAQAT